ncbi:hypothetical protein Aduo_003057 [Ancylostoma duodenale]
MFDSFAKYNIKPSMVGVSVDPRTRDLPAGYSVSFCPPSRLSETYRKTHTSMNWKVSLPTPLAPNLCDLSHLTYFDETNGYLPNQPSFTHPSPRIRRELLAVAGNAVTASTVAGNAVTATTAAAQRATAQHTRMHVAAPACDDDIVAVDNNPIPMDVISVPQFTHDDFKALSSKIDYLYTQAVAKEGQHHKEALENARTAMLAYEHSTRKNFLARDKDLLMDSAHFTSSKMTEEVEKLGSSSLFEYFRPLFGEEWIHGRRKVTIRCEPCYEAYRGTNPTLIPAIAKESGIPLDENTVKVLRNHVRPAKHKSCANVHHQSIATYEERTKKRVNDFLTAVDTRINDPIAATTRLFFLAYTATKMYLPPRQFPTLCDAAAALGMEIGKKHRTRKAYVSMTTIIGSAMEEQLINYIKIKQPPFSLLIDSSTDHGGKKIMLAYVRFADRISLHPTTHFLKAFEMHEAETAENIFLKL